ncbi:MAG: alpha/beta fold hydrolase [Leptospiraceae bacterium]|nr:alpha/beta fold hydrolase [Leptospiraceae bacterium]
MPYIQNSSYKIPFFKNGHLQTIFTALFRHTAKPEFERERLQTDDNDFLLLDWLIHSGKEKQNKKLVILSHGLEGDSSSSYIRGMANWFFKNNYDVMARNQRGCGGEPNLLLKSYHSGAIEDLDLTVRLGVKRGYKKIVLIGFSLGGNQTMLYLSGAKIKPAKEIKAGIIFSAPIDLRSCAMKLAEPQGKLYMSRFLATMRDKIKEKNRRFPGTLDLTGLEKIKDFEEWDTRFTGPIHGFKDADDYWKKCSSLPHIPKLKIPVLLVQSRNDPFLSELCFPREMSEKNKYFFLEDLQYGGHCAYTENPLGEEILWSEKRALQFAEEYCN